MAFDESKPADSESPLIGPAEIRANWVQLKALLGNGHKFNNVPAADDGYHDITKWTTQAGTFADGTPPLVAGSVLVYAKQIGATQTLMFKTQAGVEGTITGWPVRAACVFDASVLDFIGTPVVPPSQFNVSTVERVPNAPNEANYKIKFTKPIPLLCTVNITCDDINQPKGTTTTVQSMTINDLIIWCRKSDVVSYPIRDPKYISIVVMGG